MIVRASSMSRLMGYIKDEDKLLKNYLDSVENLNNKLASKNLEIPPVNDDKLYYQFVLNNYQENPPRGFKTVIENYIKFYDNYFKEDELPDGAKSYVEELFIQNNGLDLTIEGLIPATQKGHLMENEAIELVNDVLGTFYEKNDYRALYNIETGTIIRYNRYNNSKDDLICKFGITGECDIYSESESLVRDIKCPQNFDTYIKHKNINSNYYWQLITYSILWDVKNLKLDFCLMPTPFSIYENYSTENQYKVRKFNQSVENLSLNNRLKTFEIDPSEIEKAQKQVFNRVKMAAEYYKTLSLEKLIYA